MLLDGLQLVRLGGSLFEGVVFSARGISGEEAGQVGAWRGFVGVGCVGRGPGPARALSARGVSHRRLLRDAAIVLVCVCLSQACAETTRGHYKPAAQWAQSERGPAGEEEPTTPPCHRLKDRRSGSGAAAEPISQL